MRTVYNLRLVMCMSFFEHDSLTLYYVTFCNVVVQGRNPIEVCQLGDSDCTTAVGLTRDWVAVPSMPLRTIILTADKECL